MGHTPGLDRWEAFMWSRRDLRSRLEEEQNGHLKVLRLIVLKYKLAKVGTV